MPGFMNYRNPSVNVHQFAMIPRADVPRSQFIIEFNHKTTVGGSRLIPILVHEVLPGDSIACQMTAFSRMQTPIVPIMDNIRMDTWFFFVPNRLVWKHWAKFQGEQDNPGDSTSYTIPQLVSPPGGFPYISLAGYFGLPGQTQTAGTNTISVSALPFRAYNLIHHQWFRDENLQSASFVYGGASGGTNVPTDDDGPEAWTQYSQFQPDADGIQVRGKRHDYFTGCLPFTFKSIFPPASFLSGEAVVRPRANPNPEWTQQQANPGGVVDKMTWRVASNSAWGLPTNLTAPGFSTGATAILATTTTAVAGIGGDLLPSNLCADLSTVATNTVNTLRTAFQTQKLLERDARGGTRYTEIIRAHFGVMSPDARLQRAEYLGGGTSPVNITPVAQTSGTGLTGGSTPIGTLSGVGVNLARNHGFRQSFTEHGFIIGIACFTCDLTYQQGIERFWSRKTRYDFYMPVFAALGEQAVLNQELYSDGSANDAGVFGYQERWAEYRYKPSRVTGLFNSKAPTPIDYWHLAGNFGGLPVLNNQWIWDTCQNNLNRVQAGGVAINSSQFLCDFFFRMKCARPMPLYSVPGLIDHF